MEMKKAFNGFIDVTDTTKEKKISALNDYSAGITQVET